MRPFKRSVQGRCWLNSAPAWNQRRFSAAAPSSSLKVKVTGSETSLCALPLRTRRALVEQDTHSAAGNLRHEEGRPRVQRCDCLLARDGRKVRQKRIQRVAARRVPEQY